MHWTDEQLKIIPKAFYTSVETYPCISACLKEFIEYNDFYFSLLDRMEPLWKDIGQFEDTWEKVTPYWDEWELEKIKKMRPND